MSDYSENTLDISSSYIHVHTFCHKRPLKWVGVVHNCLSIIATAALCNFCCSLVRCTEISCKHDEYKLPNSIANMPNPISNVMNSITKTLLKKQ